MTPLHSGDGVVVVTGAAGGIGHATAKAALRRGLRVIGTVRRLESCASLHSEGIVPVLMDVTVAASVADAGRQVRQALGGAPLVGLVHAAGLGAVGPLEKTPPPLLADLLAVNVVGPLAVTQALLPELRAASGRVILVGSQSGRLVLPFLGAYSVSKFGLEALADGLRRELAPAGIGVVLVQPGAVRTGIQERAFVVQAENADDLVAGAAYRRFLSAWRSDSAPAIEPEAVGKTVANLLTAPRVPARRGMTPALAWRARLLVRLPARWQDRLLARRLARGS